MPRLSRLPSCVLALVMALPSVSRAIDPEAAFRSPDESAKPGVWWHWMGSNVSAEGITQDLEALADAGFGGATIFGMSDVCTPWAGRIENSPTPGLVAFTDPWWKLVAHAAAEGRRLGIDVGVHNCPGYESTGGPWIPPELSMLEIVWSETSAEGPGRVRLDLPRPEVDPRSRTEFPVYNGDTGTLERPEIPERTTFFRDVAMLAVPAEGEPAAEEVIDLTGRAGWDAPPGRWTLYRFGYTTQGTYTQPNQWEARGFECDKMSREAVEFHFTKVLGDMKRHLGDLVGTGLRHVLLDSYEAGSPTWTPRMPIEFQARRGYDLLPFLPTFAGRTIGDRAATRRFKKDFEQTIRDLYRDVYFPTIQRLCHETGVRFVCEPYGGPWNMKEVTPFVDRVMTEFWTSGGLYGGHDAFAIAAAGNGRSHAIIEAEAFTGHPRDSAWNEYPAWLKPLGDGAYLAGVNRLVLHHAVHQPWPDRHRPGNSMGRWGTHFGRLQTWFEPGKAWVRYLSRCQALLQWGEAGAGEAMTVDGGGPFCARQRRSPRDHVDLFFVVNTSGTTAGGRCSFPVSGRQPELWDPVTGLIRDLSMFEQRAGCTTLPLELAAHQSLFVVFRRPVPPAGRGPARTNMPARVPITTIAAPWKVAFDTSWGGPESIEFVPGGDGLLPDWTERPEPGVRHYSGTAIYTTSFDLPPGAAAGDCFLDLGMVRHLARVAINGRDLGVAWTAPWGVCVPRDLLQQAGNSLEIAVTNVWANRLIGDEQEPDDCEWRPGDHDAGGSYLKRFPDWFVKYQPRPSQGRHCFTIWNYFDKNSPLTPSGLRGPVRLMVDDWAPRPADQAAGADGRFPDAPEDRLARKRLVKIRATRESKPEGNGGGTDASALFNGTLRNASGGDATRGDGCTFRGYGAGAVLEIELDGPHDLEAVKVYAGHGDARASQRYRLLAASEASPSRFQPVGQACNEATGGFTETVVKTDVRRAVAVRLEFASGPLGFNVYREVQILGTR